MALTQISTQGIKDGTITGSDLATSFATTGDFTFTGANYNVVWNKASNLFQFADSAQIKFGTGNDMSIRHGSGVNIIDAITSNLEIKHGSENIAKFIPDGAVELYHDNSKKFETTSYGAKVTGRLAATTSFTGSDNVKLILGDSDDLQIFHDGSHSRIVDAGTGGLKIQSNALAIDNAGGTETMAAFTEDGSVQLRFNNLTKFETTSAGVSVTGNITASGGQLTLEDGNEEQIHRFWSNTSDSDINGLLSGSTFGTIVEGAHNGHHVIGLRGNDSSDSFAIVSGGGNYQTDDTYDKLVARFYSSGVFHMPDNNRIKLGTGNDLQIYHDGSHSYITNATNDLRILANEVIFNNANNTENKAKFINNGAVELYHDNSKKFETTSSGATITGNLIATGNLNVNDNGNINVGNSGDLQLFHNGTNSFIDSDSGNLVISSVADLRFNSADYKFMNTADNETLARFIQNGAVELYHDNEKKLHTTAGGVVVTGDFQTSGSGGTITANENLKIPNDTGKLLLGASNDLQIFHDGNNSKISHVGAGGLYIGADTFGLQKGDHSENYITMAANGAVELYHNNVKKFETTSGGVDVTGALTVNGAAIGGGGKILQVIRTANTSLRSTSNGSFVSTGVSVTITPSSSSSKVLVRCHGTMNNASAGAGGGITIYRGSSTNLAPGDGNQTASSYFGEDDSNNIENQSFAEFLDSPNTTSSVTYTVYIRAFSGTQRWGYRGDGGILAMEVAA